MTADPSDHDPSAQPIWAQAHQAAVDAGEDGYFDPNTGLFVMTEAYLIRRGTCCSNQCRHCPFGSAA
jgi:hypothetical protein